MRPIIDPDTIAITPRAAAKLLGVSLDGLLDVESTVGIAIVGGGTKYLLGDLVRAVVCYIKAGYEFPSIGPGAPDGRLAGRLISGATAARLLGISRSRVSQLFAHSGAGYRLGDVIRGYLQFLNERSWIDGWSATGRDSGGR